MGEVEKARAPLLEARGVTKRYGAVAANDGVDLSVRAGEIHALLGENGAGKSTLVKILYGAARADAGALYWKGAPLTLANPAEARARGIGMVFQHFSLFDALSVAENIALALPAGLALKDAPARVAELSKRYGLALAPDALVADLSAGERQRVEILRCLLLEPELVILDEPTSVLTPQEAEELFVTLRRFAAEGRAILYISHKLPEVQALCDRATILRRGRLVGVCDPKAVGAAKLAEMMVGAEIETPERPEARAGGSNAPALRVDNLSLGAAADAALHGAPLRNISFEVRAGEIVAIAGVAGNGQSELFAALSGETLADAPGAVEMLGQGVGRRGVSARRRLGVAFVSEDRLGHGAAPEHALSENTLLTRAATDPGLTRGGFVRRGAMRALKDHLCAHFDVRKTANDPAAAALSGGNLQKFIMGREVDRAPALLIVNQPSWGVDAGAVARIRQTLLDRAAEGCAILMISQDLDEIFDLADRIAALTEGRLSPAVPRAQATRESVGRLMTDLSAWAA